VFAIGTSEPPLTGGPLVEKRLTPFTAKVTFRG